MTAVDLKRLKVLLIDDEWFVRSTLRQILIQIGITNIYDAADVKAGLTETMRTQPHVVFCDIHMPGEDGLAYVAAMRKSPVAGVASIPVVMLTSDSSEESVLSAKDLKVDGYLVKPVSIAAVKRAVERALKTTLA